MHIDFGNLGEDSATKTQANARQLEGEETMGFDINRRVLMAAGAALLAWGTAGPATAQAPTNLRFSAVFSEQDIRSGMMK